MSKITQQIKKVSQNPGVYIFKNKFGKVLYVGKATNLRSRVASYFSSSSKESRPVMNVISQIEKIETKETETVLEALILEANLIKKFQPKYNVDLKDDKSFSYVVITREEFPRVLIVREKELSKIINSKDKNKILNTRYQIPYTNQFGPYTSKKQLEEALKIIRRIFPYHSRREKSEKGCLDFQLGLCPGPYVENISKKDYQKNIQNIQMILRGSKKNLVKKLEREMKEASKKEEFEKAAKLRNQIFALNHIRDVALISREDKFKTLRPKTYPLKTRIEAYDISNISGDQAVGSMVVFDEGGPQKNQYRKFKIKNVDGPNDVGMMAEVLFRRFGNRWKKPDLILLDGGKGHLNMAEKVLKELGFKIPIIAVAKGPTRKISNFKFIISKSFPIHQEQKTIINNKDFIGRIIEEAHRFAVSYHRKVRSKSFIRRK